MSSRGSDDLSIGLDGNWENGQRELNNNKTVKGKYQVKIMLEILFGFAEWQEEATSALTYDIKRIRNQDSAVVNKSGATTKAKL